MSTLRRIEPMSNFGFIIYFLRCLTNMRTVHFGYKRSHGSLSVSACIRFCFLFFCWGFSLSNSFLATVFFFTIFAHFFVWKVYTCLIHFETNLSWDKESAQNAMHRSNTQHQKIQQRPQFSLLVLYHHYVQRKTTANNQSICRVVLIQCAHFKAYTHGFSWFSVFSIFR